MWNLCERIESNNHEWFFVSNLDVNLCRRIESKLRDLAELGLKVRESLREKSDTTS
jgi:hypothetical protein